MTVNEIRSPILVLLFSLTLLSCWKFDNFDEPVTASIFIEGLGERALLEEYQRLYKAKDVKLKFYDYKASLQNDLRRAATAGDLPDIFSLWEDSQLRYLVELDELVDVRKLIDESILDPLVIRGYKDEPMWNEQIWNEPIWNEPMWLVPLTYELSNALLINMDLYPWGTAEDRRQIELKTYEDFNALTQLVSYYGLTSLVISNPDPSSLGDMFLSSFVGWGNPSWFSDLLKGKVRFSDLEFLQALEYFSVFFVNKVIDSSILSLDWAEAQDMFRQEKAFMIIGGLRELEGLVKEMDAELMLEVFPGSTYDEAGIKGAGKGSLLGVGARKDVLRYGPIRKLYVESLLRFYTGSYAGTSRIRKFERPATLKDFSLLPGQSEGFIKEMEFLSSLSFLYETPSVVLPEELDQKLNQGLRNIAQRVQTPGSLSKLLEDFLKKILADSE